ncbi:MAG: acyltransferase [Muribaculaceae bacterium]|nr:acyltransferase [Muribaculaceae bacterium]
MIKTINSWRGIIAVVVVLFHGGMTGLWDLGHAGVTFFFVASAFLLMMRHPFDSLSAREYRNFVLEHAARLYPLNWLALALMVVMVHAFHSAIVDWVNVVLTALMLHSWSPLHDMHYGVNPVAWFSCVLMFCYLVYPLLARLTNRWRWYHIALAIVMMILVFSCFLPGMNVPEREAVFVNPLSHVLDFTLGILLYRVYRALKGRCQSVNFTTASFLELGAWSLFALVIIIRHTTSWLTQWEDWIIWLLPQGAILLVMALLNGQEGLLGKILTFRPLQWLGNISFEVYMLQFVAFLFFNYVVAPVLGHFGIMVYDHKLIGVWLVLLPLAWLVNRYFSRPLKALFKRNFQYNNQ